MSVKPHQKGAPTQSPIALEIPKSRSNGADNTTVVGQRQDANGEGKEGATNGEQTQSRLTQGSPAGNTPESPNGPPANSYNSSNDPKTSTGPTPASNSAQKQQYSAAAPTHEPHSPIDPLSQQIIKRTNTDKSVSKLRSQPLVDNEATGVSDARRSLAHEDHSGGIRSENNAGQQKAPKDKKKGVSFLSRFIGGKKRGVASESNDDASELGEQRAAGMDAEVFAQPIGFIPRYPPPPKYIKVRSNHKKERDFNRLFVAQELRGSMERAKTSFDKSSASNSGEPDGQERTGRAIWVLKFSKDGKYLAAAGQDRVVRLWAVIATPEDRQAHEIEEEARNDQPLVRLSAPVFKSQPVQEFEGHTACVVDVSWSKNNFLLSTSMDKTVRLWHVTRNECLCIFKHSDFVTSIEFHPRDDRFFLAGSLDSKLRLWSIPDKNVAFVAGVPDMVTAVAFTPDGKHSIAGCLNGLCLVFDTDGLKIQSQIHVRSARGRNAKGSKITGIETVVHPPDSENGVVKLLITSNDSRIRLYNFRDRTLEAKFRGNENATSQIRASFSSDGRYLICGSEDRRAYIWPLTSPLKDADKRPVEIFEAHPSVVTSAVFAPVKTKQVLGSTGDLLYDLCNPPPVTLVSQAPSTVSKQATEDESRRNDEPGRPLTGTSGMANRRKVEESPAYLARSTHPGGNIIVTADYTGSIKVFRQDCGYHKRGHGPLDGNSSFSRKLLGRASSISRRRSRASSIGKDSHHKTPSDRILSWRSGVIGSNDNNSLDNLRSSLGSRTGSVSPNRSIRRTSTHHPDAAQGGTQPATQQPRNPGSPLRVSRQPASVQPFPVIDHPEAQKPALEEDDVSTPLAQQQPDPLWLKGDQSYMFWNTARLAAQASRAARPSFLDQTSDDGEGRRRSEISDLSSDLSYTGEEDDEASEEGRETEDGEELSCRRCAGTNFRATRTRQGEQRLICVQCGSAAS